MVGLTVTALVLACLSLSWAQGPAQTSPSLQCDAQGISRVRVAVTSVKNATGHWTSAIAVNQNGNSETVDFNNPSPSNWHVTVEQTANRCHQYNSVLETIIYLTAPSPTMDNFVRPDLPWNWQCPACPESRPCPSERPVTARPQPPTRPPSISGYDYHEGLGSYKFHDKPLSWPEAKEKCKSEGTHLVVINSEKEGELVKSYIGQYPYPLGATSYYYVWVGANKISGEFTTVLGGKLSDTGFARWAPAKPNNPLYAFCLAVDRPHTWYHDIVCSWKLAFICEQYHDTENTVV